MQATELGEKPGGAGKAEDPPKLTQFGRTDSTPPY